MTVVTLRAKTLGIKCKVYSILCFFWRECQRQRVNSSDTKCRSQKVVTPRSYKNYWTTYVKKNSNYLNVQDKSSTLNVFFLPHKLFLRFCLTSCSHRNKVKLSQYFSQQQNTFHFIIHVFIFRSLREEVTLNLLQYPGLEGMDTY